MAVRNKKFERPEYPFVTFSPKQRLVLNFWRMKMFKGIDALICDGSVRSGKTSSMIMSYVMWAMETFNNANFGIGGYTMNTLRRNVIEPMKAMMAHSGYDIIDNESKNTITVYIGNKRNTFLLYEGKDARSYTKVQGLTAKGFFFDEVALLDKTFVEQALARADDPDGLYWFNCNPAGPYHWFYQDWILDEKHKHNTLQLHFRMEDNLYLDKRVIDRFKRMYSGVFYERYILGKWVLAEGIVYSNFNEKTMVKDLPKNAIVDDRRVGCDYGGDHPFAYSLAEHNKLDDTWYFTKEYYYDGDSGTLYVTGMNKPIKVPEKDDKDFLNDLSDFLGGKSIKEVIVDPSAKTFRTMLKKNGYKVRKADNAVIDGINLFRMRMNDGSIRFGSDLPNTRRELGSYAWDQKAQQRGVDKVIKIHDHIMDADRYIVKRVLPVKRTGNGLKLFNM